MAPRNSTAVLFWGQTTLFPSVLSPKRDCGPTRLLGVNAKPQKLNRCRSTGAIYISRAADTYLVVPTAVLESAYSSARPRTYYARERTTGKSAQSWQQEINQPSPSRCSRATSIKPSPRSKRTARAARFPCLPVPRFTVAALRRVPGAVHSP